MYRDAPVDPTDRITAALATALTPLRFKSKAIGDRLEFVRHGFGVMETEGEDVVPIKGAWVRKSLFANDAVLHLGAPDDSPQRLSELAVRVEQRVAPRIGYLAYLWPISLQIVWSGERIYERSDKLYTAMMQSEAVERTRFGQEYTVRYSDPRSNIRGLFVVDLVAKRLIRQGYGTALRSKHYQAIDKCLAALVTG
jgi:hypothetical protein